MRILRILTFCLVLFTGCLFALAIAGALVSKTTCGCVEKMTDEHYWDLCLYTDAWLFWWHPHGQGSFPFKMKTFDPAEEASAWDPEPYYDPLVTFEFMGLRVGEDELNGSILDPKYVVVPHWQAIVVTGLIPVLWLLIGVIRLVRRKGKKPADSAKPAAA